MKKSQQFDYPWILREYIYKLIENSIKKGNKTKTIIDKIKFIFQLNNELFKSSDSEAIYEGRLINLQRKERCFNFLKSGYFNFEGLGSYVKISDVKNIDYYGNNIYKMTNNLGKQTKISERDYYDLKLLIT